MRVHLLQTPLALFFCFLSVEEVIQSSALLLSIALLGCSSDFFVIVVLIVKNYDWRGISWCRRCADVPSRRTLILALLFMLLPEDFQVILEIRVSEEKLRLFHDVVRRRQPLINLTAVDVVRLDLAVTSEVLRELVREHELEPLLLIVVGQVVEFDEAGCD